MAIPAATIIEEVFSPLQVFGIKKALGMTPGERPVCNGAEYLSPVSYWEELVEDKYAVRVQTSEKRIIYRVTYQTALLFAEDLRLKDYELISIKHIPFFGRI